MREIILTSVYGEHAGRLGRTFTSFAAHTGAELHAFVHGDLPENREPGVHYHRVDSDHTLGEVYREACYRRWEYMDRLDADFCMVVDATDVLCLQDLPDIQTLLRGAAVGACVEHFGHYYLPGQAYTSNYLNAGVTLWDVRQSRPIRQEILQRGRATFRSLVDDQYVFNEVIQSRYYDELTILPCQYNYRAFLNRVFPGWPTVDNLDGVKIYHCGLCIEAALALRSIQPKAELEPFEMGSRTPKRTLQLRSPITWVCQGPFDGVVPEIANKSFGGWLWPSKFRRKR